MLFDCQKGLMRLARLIDPLFVRLSFNESVDELKEVVLGGAADLF